MTPPTQDSSDLPERGQRLGPGVWARRADLRFAFSRSSGPGGQAVNKLSTRAELRITLGDIQGLPEDAAARLRRLAGSRVTQEDELIITASTFRSQLDNKLACLDKLSDLVKRALHRPKARRKTKPTRGMIEKRLAGKRKTSEKKSLRRSRTDHD